MAKQRPGLNFGIIKLERTMNNKIYRYKEGQNYWTCHLIEKRSYLSCLKAFDSCANFDHKVTENGLEHLNKRLV